MKCPFCGHDGTQVAETRLADDAVAVRRRRRCVACEKRFTTFERVDMGFPLIVKKDNSRVEYLRQKVQASMAVATRKRPVTAQQIESAITRLEEELLASSRKEVPSDFIGALLMRELKQLDKVAYIRFASVYRDFQDVGDFRTLVDEFQEPVQK